MLYALPGKTPRIAPSAYIAPGAFVIGAVEIGENSSVWFNSVLRGDEEAIFIGKETNIQDNCTLHGDEGIPVRIGDRVTVGHNAVLHGCLVGSGAVVGMQSTLLNGSQVGEDSIIGAGSVVMPGTVIPPRSLALGNPARVVRELTPEEIEKAHQLYLIYVDRSRVYRMELSSTK